ncbi:MAG: glycosyltransferase family 2 protein [Candidatus Woesebacteria bacterium]
MQLSIIIVSYNTNNLTIQTIESVGFDSRHEIIVVDNDSKDGSVKTLKERFGNKIKIIERHDNGGFAKANNEGIKAAKGDYILLLNSDTIVVSGAIDSMVKTLEENPKVGILSCRLLNPDGSYQSQGGGLPTFWNIAWWWLWPLPGNVPFVNPYQNSTVIQKEDRPDHIIKRGWVGGTAMMIRKEVIEQIGGLDEKIFMYAEDVDYCIRAHQKGWLIGITPNASITHIGSASTSSNHALLGEVKGLNYLSKKHFPFWQRPLVYLILLKGAILRGFLFGILLGRADARSLYGAILRELT